MAFVKGMDLETLEVFRSSLKDNPVTLGLETRTKVTPEETPPTSALSPWVNKKLTAAPAGIPSPTEPGRRSRKLSDSRDTPTVSSP